MPLSDNDRKALSCDPSDYDFKYTIQASATSWLMVYHFKPIDLDVEILVYNLDFERKNTVFKYQRHLLNLRSKYILLPEKVFNWSGELWFIFPLYDGRYLDEVLTMLRGNGLPNERITARILLDVLEGLEMLHEANLCHRALCPQTLFIEKSSGVTKLKDFSNLKSFEEDDEKGTRNKPKLPSSQHRHLQPPELFGLYGDEKVEEVDERKADIFLFAITAMNLAYGTVPPSPFAKNEKVKPEDWRSPSSKSYSFQPEHISPAFKDMLVPCLARSTRDRPSASELKKDKFFGKAASYSELKDEICSLFKKSGNPPILNELPPSQRQDIGASTVRPQWDFGSECRVTETKISERDLLEESKDTPLELTIDDVLEQDSARNVAYKQKYPKNGLSTASPNVETVMDNEELKEGDHLLAQRGRDKMSRFRVQKVQTYGDQQETLQLTIDNPTERKENVNTDEQASHNPKKKPRFHVEDAGEIRSRAGNEYLSMPAPVQYPIKTQSAPQKIGKPSRFKVSEVPVSGLPAQISNVNSTVSSIPASVKAIPGTSEAKAKIPQYKTKPPIKWEVDDVCEWLKDLGGDFEGYTSFFKKSGIDGDMLQHLTSQELEELHVKLMIHRRKVLTSIKKLDWS